MTDTTFTDKMLFTNMLQSPTCNTEVTHLGADAETAHSSTNLNTHTINTTNNNNPSEEKTSFKKAKISPFRRFFNVIKPIFKDFTFIIILFI